MRTVHQEKMDDNDSEKLVLQVASGAETHTEADRTVNMIYGGPRTIRFQEITPNSDSSRKAWKDFENYVVFSAPSHDSLSSLTAWASIWEFYPQYYSTSSRHVLFGYGGYQPTGGGFFRPFGDPGRPFSGLPSFYDKRPDGGFVPPPADLAELEQKALRSMLPSMKSELSSVNSLIELKDFVSLPQLIRELGRYSFLLTYQSIREAVRLGAGATLQWKFNIRPLISDIAGIFRALSSLERRINDLLTRAGTPQRKHFAYEWQEFPPTVTETSQGYYVFAQYQLPTSYYLNTFRTRRVANTPKSQFHAEIEYNFNFTQYQIEHARILGLLDAFGVNLNPAIIWNAIPWSFVVDWVIGVSRWLDNFKVENMKPVINIRRYLWSIKRERVVHLTRIADTATGAYGFPALPSQRAEAPMPSVREVAYRRFTGVPDTSSLITSGLSSEEFSLGADLVLARRRSRPKR
jgi:hypothetical protein